jgi:hypothetical protein
LLRPVAAFKNVLTNQGAPAFWYVSRTANANSLPATIRSNGIKKKGQELVVIRITYPDFSSAPLAKVFPGPQISDS